MRSVFLTSAFILITFLTSCDSEITEHTGHGEGNGAIAAMELRSPPAVANFKFDSDDEEGSSSFKFDKEDDIDLSVKSKIDKKKLIKDGLISVTAKDIFSSKKSIDSLLKKFDAYYDKENLENDERQISYELVIRVPAQHFEKLIAGIENGDGEITSKSIYARDVTEEYIDNEVRLETKREYLKRFKELLPKAATVKDILALEENIRTLQEEIESREGRLKYLDDQVAYSRLIINLLQKKEFVFKPQPQDKFPERVKKSLNQGWKSVVDCVLWLISHWPIILVVAALIILIRWFRKKRREKRNIE